MEKKKLTILYVYKFHNNKGLQCSEKNLTWYNFLSMIDLSSIIHKKVCNHTFLDHSSFEIHHNVVYRKQCHRPIEKLEPLYERNINIPFQDIFCAYIIYCKCIVSVYIRDRDHVL